MSDIKNLIKAKSHDPYREFEIVSYLTCFETAHKEFFKFMAEKGHELYKKKDYLRKTISDFAKKLKHDIKEQDLTLVEGRNYLVAPNLSDDDVQRLVWKWQGNLMEIIAGWMFMNNLHPYTADFTFDEMCGDDRKDMGVDGWVRSTVCRNFFYGVQVKYRFEKDVNWNDQITKCAFLTEQRIRQLYQDNQLTDEEWVKWGKQIQKRVILVTTTGLSDLVVETVSKNVFYVIDENILLHYLGMENNVNPKKVIWENLYNYIIS